MSDKVRILYAEDNLQDADQTRAHLAENAPEFEVEIAESGQVFLERLRNESFDLLLLDFRLPDMDGLDVLRELLKADIRLPVVMVTGLGADELIVKALRMGVADYVPKTGNYLQTLHQHLSDVLAEHRIEPRGMLRPIAPRRILYVDHLSADIEKTLQHFAEHAPHFVLDVIKSSNQALRCLAETPNYDLALIALSMPDRSGLDLVHEAKRLHLSLPPFVMIANAGNDEAALAALKLGATDYTVKREGYLYQLTYTIERVIAHRQLDLVNQQLLADSIAKSEFLANMSHEIRTPLNAIIGLTYLLADGDLNEAQQQVVSKIQFSGRALLGIVNDVLDLSKIEAKEMSVEHVAFQLRDLLEELAGLFASHAQAKGLAFQMNLDRQLPLWVESDAVRLRQMLTNLMSNAVKFTAQGQVELSAQLMPPRVGPIAEAARVRFTVKDSGIGIAEETVPKLFKPFTQADGSTSRLFGGTGLGLSIVREFALLLDGEVGLESERGVGSSFWVELPMRIPSPYEVADYEKRDASLFLLIAEDNLSDAKLLEKSARALGWRTHVVSDGSDLVETYTAWHKNGQPLPDALIVDWQMPKMDGLQAMATLAEQLGRDALPAVLVVSAFESKEVAASDRSHLVERILQKPVESSALFNAVNDVVTHHSGNSSRVLQASRTEAVRAHWLPGVRVLVVDDSSLNLEVVQKILERNGAVVTTVDNGKDALAQLQLPSNDFDVVLMDVQMPHMDGLETTRHVREHPGLASLPIIALTAGALVEERRRALESGMNDFLTKPVDPAQLISRLRSAVERYRAKSVAVESISKAAPVHDGEWPHIQGLNSESAKRLLVGDASLFLSTVTRLLDEHGALDTPVGAEIDQADAAAMRQEIAAKVHKLRSAAGMVGAEQLHQLAAQAETVLRTPGQPARDLLAKLAVSLRELREQSSPVLQAWRQMHAAKQASEPHAEAPAVSVHEWQQLIALLSQNDLTALDWIEKHEALLQEGLGLDGFEQLQSSLGRLQFKHAQALLKPWLEKNGVAT